MIPAPDPGVVRATVQHTRDLIMPNDVEVRCIESDTEGGVDEIGWWETDGAAGCRAEFVV